MGWLILIGVGKGCDAFFFGVVATNVLALEIVDLLGLGVEIDGALAYLDLLDGDVDDVVDL